MTSARDRVVVLGVALTALVAASASAAVVTRGPYLQVATPTSMIVRWRTDVATDSRVAHGAAPGSLTTTVNVAGLTTEHEVAVGDLGADTLYYYSVGSTSGALVGDDTAHSFRTPPVPGTPKPTRIWVTGDGGFANANGMAVRDAYATYNAGNPTDLWLLLGDNAYLFGTDADYEAALFDMHQDMLRRVPAWPTFGNHEAFSSNSLTQTGPYFDMFTLPAGGQAGGVPSGTESYYAFDYANLHFIVLDGNSSSTATGSAMRLWLEADLQATTADWIVAYWHHPPYSKGLFHDSDVEAREIRMREDILPVLEAYGVDLVLCGHSHNYERSMFLDGHYGFSGTLTASMSLDSGDGSPAGDGAYRKPGGQNPNEGAVYVVAGSSSEVRNATLNHPAMKVNHLQLGSLILDVNGKTLTGTFLNSLVQTTDTFTIAKGPACPPTPSSGCGTAPDGRLVLRNQSPDVNDKLVWRWRRGTIAGAQVGTPTAHTDLAVCVYDQSGFKVGGAVSHGADAAAGALWKPQRTAGQYLYLNSTGSESGITELRLKPTGTTQKTLVRAKGAGAGLQMPSLPLAFPMTAQLVNLDTGACWESVFAAPRRNEPTRVIAQFP